MHLEDSDRNRESSPRKAFTIRPWLICILMFCVSSAPSRVSAQEMYSRDDLRAVKSFWEQQLKDVRQESIAPSLSSDQRKIFKHIHWEFPNEGGGSLIGFRAASSQVILPIPSLMFTQDLVVAYVWQDVQRCPSTVLTYSNFLKYRDPRLLPGGRFPDPIEAMGIPSPNTASSLKSAQNLPSASSVYSTAPCSLRRHMRLGTLFWATPRQVPSIRRSRRTTSLSPSWLNNKSTPRV